MHPLSDKPRAEERLLLKVGAEVTILFSAPWGSERDVHCIHQVYMEDANHKTVQGKIFICGIMVSMVMS